MARRRPNPRERQTASRNIGAAQYRTRQRERRQEQPSSPGASPERAPQGPTSAPARQPSGGPTPHVPVQSSGGRLSALQVARAAYEAGFRGEQLVTMVAIAFPESGLSPTAYNPRGRDRSYGLWQINMHPETGRSPSTFGLSSHEQLFDPVNNAHAAKQIYNSQGFRAWSVYKNGQYRKHLTRARQVVAELTNVGIESVPIPRGGGGVGGPMSSGQGGSTFDSFSEEPAVITEQDVRAMYQRYFGRNAKPSEIQRWVGQEDIEGITEEPEAQAFTGARMIQSINRRAGSI